jgi:hypothetical protein
VRTPAVRLFYHTKSGNQIQRRLVRQKSKGEIATIQVVRVMATQMFVFLSRMIRVLTDTIISLPRLRQNCQLQDQKMEAIRARHRGEYELRI